MARSPEREASVFRSDQWAGIHLETVKAENLNYTSLVYAVPEIRQLMMPDVELLVAEEFLRSITGNLKLDLNPSKVVRKDGRRGLPFGLSDGELTLWCSTSGQHGVRRA